MSLTIRLLIWFSFMVVALRCVASENCSTAFPKKRAYLPPFPDGVIKIDLMISRIDNHTKENHTGAVMTYESRFVEELMTTAGITKGAATSAEMSGVLQRYFRDEKKDQNIEVDSQWIFNWTSGEYHYIKDAANCYTGKNWSKESVNTSGDPLAFPMNAFPSGTTQPIPRSVMDLLSIANDTKGHLKGNLESTGGAASQGLPFNRFLSCTLLEETDEAHKWLEMTLGYINNSVTGWDSTVRDGVPIFIDVRVYEIHSSNVSSEDKKKKNRTAVYPSHVINYLITNPVTKVSNTDKERFLLPPPGVKCPSSSQKPFPAFPRAFTATISVRDVKNELIDNIELMYDEHEKLISFVFNRTDRLSDNKLFVNGITKDDGRYFVVHDYKTGLQFMKSLDEETEDCGVSHLDKQATGEPAEGSATLIRLKGPMELLIGHSNISADDFIYVGIRTFGDILADVWIAETETTDSNGQPSITVSEIYFSADTFTVLSGQKHNGSQLLAIKHYTKQHQDAANKFPQKGMIYLIQSLVAFDNNNSEQAWSHLDASGCLTPVNDSFVAAVIDGATKPDWKRLKADVSELSSALRQRVSELSNVSLLRVTDIQVNQLMDGSPALYFNMLNASILPWKNVTLDQIPETSLAGALKVINETLIKSGITITVEFGKKEKTLSLKKEALYSVPRLYKYFGQPTTSNKIYSAGQMGGAVFGTIVILAVLVGLGLFAPRYYRKWRGSEGYHQQIDEV